MVLVRVAEMGLICVLILLCRRPVVPVRVFSFFVAMFSFYRFGVSHVCSCQGVKIMLLRQNLNNNYSRRVG